MNPLIWLPAVAWVGYLAARGISRWAAGRVERDVSAGLRYGPDDDFWDRP